MSHLFFLVIALLSAPASVYGSDSVRYWGVHLSIGTLGWFYNDSHTGTVEPSLVWASSPWLPALLDVNTCDVNAAIWFLDPYVSPGNCPAFLAAQDINTDGPITPQCDIGCLPGYTPTAASRTSVVCAAGHGVTPTAPFVFQSALMITTSDSVLDSSVSSGFTCVPGNAADTAYMPAIGAPRGRGTVWPDNMMSGDNTCTNPVPSQNEMCVRVCARNADCGAGTTCHAGVCSCNMLDSAQCNGKGVCGRAGRQDSFWGLCFCDPANPPANSASCGPIAPDVGFATDNLEWASRHADLLTAYGSPSSQIKGVLPKLTLTQGEGMWSFGSKSPGFVYTLALPPMAQCNPGWHGPMCDNFVDQLADNICGGGDLGVVDDASGTLIPWIHGFTTLSNLHAAVAVPIANTFELAMVTSILALSPVRSVAGNAPSSTGTSANPYPNGLYCNCPVGYGPFDVALMTDLTSLDNNNLLMPGHSCTTVIDADLLYCNNHGKATQDPATRAWSCACDAFTSGPACQFDCASSYCNGHGTCTVLGGQNRCTNCSTGWGPAQTGSAEDSDASYSQSWCGVPYGPDRSALVTGRPLSVPLECNGVGFAISTMGIGSIPSPSLALVAPFDTHPLHVKQEMPSLSAAQLSRYGLIYQAAVTVPGGARCAYCDDGWTAHGTQCLPNRCKAWSTCHGSDVTCTRGASAPTNAQCGADVGRGTCTLSASADAFSCSCAPGYGGPDCSQVWCAWANGRSCNNHGTCNMQHNRCICDAGWVGAACEIYQSQQAGACHGHGQTSTVSPPFAGNPAAGSQPSPYAYKLANYASMTRSAWY